MMDVKEMLEKVQDFKEESIFNGFEKPQGLDEFFNENWMQILDILDDAIYQYLNR